MTSSIPAGAARAAKSGAIFGENLGGVKAGPVAWPLARVLLSLDSAATEARPMIVPLTLGDFLERAEGVYGDREGVVDEPNPPGGGLGRFTYSAFAEMARSLAAALDDL